MQVLLLANVFIGAFAMNILYAGFLLIKNNSFSSFSIKDSGKLINGQLLLVFVGLPLEMCNWAALMGSLGNIVGWPMLLGLSLIISNYWAFRAGEWDDAKNHLKFLFLELLYWYWLVLYWATQIWLLRILTYILMVPIRNSLMTIPSI